MSPAPSLALVVNTFNQPDYLFRLLNSLSRQTQLPQEVVLADDGSDDQTRAAFEAWAAKQPFPCARVWQEHTGFRRARILNLAIARAASAYLVFLDGDTVPHPAFVADHLRLARPGTFVQGHRALIEQAGASFFGLGEFTADRRRALFRRQLRGLKHAYRAIWRDDLIKVNGYNEAFTGWGREDSELAVRLMNAGARRLDVRGWAICYHLWHPPASRANLPANDQLLETAQAQTATRCDAGLSAHLPKTQPLTE
jgi:glycosyltransferase involved in cell wall biosynthesis